MSEPPRGIQPGNGVEEYLFDPRLLERIVDIKDGIWVRPLSIEDYDKGFIQVLGQLTKVGDMSKEQFSERFRKMKASGDYYVIVAEDKNVGEVIASATLLTEQKFIHNCALRGRLEDVVVNDKYRGKSLGQLMVRTVSLLAQRLRCYKLSLDCKDTIVKFYERLGFIKEPANGNHLNARFDYESPTSNL
ncbi:probable glucosamine 6-phosphate N-acetyltransferase [Neodiprion virginianus]|uniref:probable glucosamine 6-phosphate N-acetyltransferase n=1 Tax=Neodiprion fabricii TaxID=2872261 RepID=UPI001ED91D62|nr:probable glucosamine 6-phosphate N-acetyltransferase [Neodiprion fabricii]XP_046617440.1 probable glucosamine 6-phosphate N-acetyltransferase [Neodiprion virginianus]